MNNDLISRKALAEELSSLSMTIVGLRAGKGVLREFMTEYRKSVLRIVDEAPSVDVEPANMMLEADRMRWISVKDRLPELDQDVLVYAKGKEDGFLDCTHIVISQRYTFHIFEWDKGVEEWQAPWPYFNRNYEVTHWMPLPELPKEG